MKKLKQSIIQLKRFLTTCSQHHNGAYAAQAAYFLMLSLIPSMILLLTLIQYTPVTQEVLMNAVIKIFPTTVKGFIISIISQVYNQSSSIIPITIVTALWSAGKGVLAITSGLNCTYDCMETRNYFFLRFRATFYTVLFIIAIIFTLLLSVFGNGLSAFILRHFKFLVTLVDFLMRMRTLFALAFLFILGVLVYTFLPNRKNHFRYQIPGAMFTTIGWLLMSYFFSIYLDIFTGFSSMYGSLTTIVLIMLWMYFCMYIMMLGGEINVLIEQILDNQDSYVKIEKVKSDDRA